MNSIAISIAEIVTRFEWDDVDIRPQVTDDEAKFLCDAADADLVIRVVVGEPPDLAEASRLFACSTWSIDDMPEGRMLTTGIVRGATHPLRRIVFNREMTRATMYLHESFPTSPWVENLPGNFMPFEHPSMELLTYWVLVKRGGIGLHASGVKTDTGGVVFSGMSGAGKSTISGIWMDTGEITILSDDRIGARPDDDGYRIHGTPWHGTLDVCNADSAPLRAIFFIGHGERNEVTPISGAEACATLVARAFPFYFDNADLAEGLERADRITATVPCYSLKFVPDLSAIELVKRTLGEL
jgi:hypothetical protein